MARSTVNLIVFSVLFTGLTILQLPLTLVAEATDECSQDFTNAEFLVFGEVHGTKELPAFVADFVAERARQHDIVLAVELSRDDAIFYARMGEISEQSEFRAQLLQLRQWQRPNDARASTAMADLLWDVSRLEAEDGYSSVRVVPFGLSYDDPRIQTQEARERALAEELRAIRRAEPKDVQIVVFTGNLHARLTKGYPWDSEIEPMAYLLSKHFTVQSLNGAYSTGNAWGCWSSGDGEQCGLRELRGAEWDNSCEISTTAYEPSPTESSAFTGRFWVGEITASNLLKDVEDRKPASDD